MTPDPRAPLTAPPPAGGWQVMAMHLYNTTLTQAYGTLGGVDLFATPRTSWRVCLNGQTDPAENGIYGIVSGGSGDLINGVNTPADTLTALNITVSQGAVYRYDHSSQIERLVNGSEEITTGAFFVAKAGYVSLYASQYFLNVPLTARIYPGILARTTDADSAQDFGNGTGGQRLEVLFGPQAGLWELERSSGADFGFSPITFSRLGAIPTAAPNAAATATTAEPSLNGNPNKDIGYDLRGPQGPQATTPGTPAKNLNGGDSTDSPTKSAPAVPMLGIRTLVTLNGSPVTVADEPVTCLF